MSYTNVFKTWKRADLPEAMINFNYVGRGTESIGLSISDQYSTKTRAAYLTETLSRLNQIKAELTA